MNNDPQQPHFIVRNFDKHKRHEATLCCPLCQNEYPSRTRLTEHAKNSHPHVAALAPDGLEWRNFLDSASSKQKHGALSRPTPETLERAKKPSSNESMMIHVGGESQTAASRPASAQDNPIPPSRRISEFKNLRIKPEPSTRSGHAMNSPKRDDPMEPFSDHSRGLPEEKPSSRVRKLQATSDIPFGTSDTGARRSRKAGNQRLFSPGTDAATFGHPDTGALDTSALFSNQESQHKVTKELPVNEQSTDFSPASKFRATESLDGPKADTQTKHTDPPDSPERMDTTWDREPELLLQPETRPVPYDQLVDEVKGIYAGLVMVEAKCIEVDDKQTLAVQDKDPMKYGKLTPEQYSALIALHKTLLNEHHDFFLACQHPSATPAVRRLPIKYSMPARMWRHAIHSFLEVLRFRLPDSLDHMLAFIYIAYSMTALLYETVPSFEDTWIECLGDLGRYRMAIEDDDIRDREIWSNVAWSWYSKAVDRNPKTGRLNHHLAILARAYTIQQLSLYARALTCVMPFDSARTSVMSLFTPIMDGKDSPHLRPTLPEIMFIKAHGLLFTGKGDKELRKCVEQLIIRGKFASFVIHMGLKFRQGIGAFVAVSCIAALLHFGEAWPTGESKSILRKAYDRASAQKEPAMSKFASSQIEPLSVLETMGNDDVQSSKRTVDRAAPLAFGILRIGLRFRGDPNVSPMIHVYLIFIWSLYDTAGGMDYVEELIPWLEIAEFLNYLAEGKAADSSIFSDTFPSMDGENPCRPLLEDFIVRGQIYAQSYYPKPFFSDAAIDDEERDRELASMQEARNTRIRWLGRRLASQKQHIQYDAESKRYSETTHAQSLRKRNPLPELEPIAMLPKEDHPLSGTARSGNTAIQGADTQRRKPYAEKARHLQEPLKDSPAKARQILKRELKDDAEMTEAKQADKETTNLTPTSEQPQFRADREQRPHDAVEFPSFKKDSRGSRHNSDTVIAGPNDPFEMEVV